MGIGVAVGVFSHVTQTAKRVTLSMWDHCAIYGTNNVKISRLVCMAG